MLSSAPSAAPYAAADDGAAARGLVAPTVLDLLQSLRRVCGAPEALRLWSGAATATGLHGVDLPPDDQITALSALLAGDLPPAVRAVATSHLTRVHTHRILLQYRSRT